MVNIRKNYLNGTQFWYISIRELKNLTYLGEIEKR